MIMMFMKTFSSFAIFESGLLYFGFIVGVRIGCNPNTFQNNLDLSLFWSRSLERFSSITLKVSCTLRSVPVITGINFPGILFSAIPMTENYPWKSKKFFLLTKIWGSEDFGKNLGEARWVSNFLLILFWQSENL